MLTHSITSLFARFRKALGVVKIKSSFEGEQVDMIEAQDTSNITLTKQKLNISYKPALNLIVAEGDSTALDVLPVYRKLTQQVTDHFENSKRLTCYFHYSVINATTVKLLFNLFDVLQQAHLNGKKISVNWLIDEDNPEMERAGMQLTKFIEFDFKILIS